jgi:CRISPR/Cas system-associated exonuclease Cas4 (RecB family)
MVGLDALKQRKNSLDKSFKQSFLPVYDCYNIDSPSGRIYVTPDGSRFPSVTTFLGSLETDTGWFDRWAEKLGGKDKAEAESARCADRGTGVHLALEHLLKNNPNPELAGDYKFMYHQIETVLRIHVDEIHGLEIPLWSKVMQLAGRCDCIAKYNGQLAIIDFKTASKAKMANWITNYFLQATCYSIMLEELYGLKAEKLVILISVENGTQAQVFTRDRRDYTFLLAEKIKEFRMKQQSKQELTSLFDGFSV